MNTLQLKFSDLKYSGQTFMLPDSHKRIFGEGGHQECHVWNKGVTTCKRWYGWSHLAEVYEELNDRPIILIKDANNRWPIGATVTLSQLHLGQAFLFVNRSSDKSEERPWRVSETVSPHWDGAFIMPESFLSQFDRKGADKGTLWGSRMVTIVNLDDYKTLVKKPRLLKELLPGQCCFFATDTGDRSMNIHTDGPFPKDLPPRGWTWTNSNLFDCTVNEGPDKGKTWGDREVTLIPTYRKETEPVVDPKLEDLPGLVIDGRRLGDLLTEHTNHLRGEIKAPLTMSEVQLKAVLVCRSQILACLQKGAREEEQRKKIANQIVLDIDYDLC